MSFTSQEEAQRVSGALLAAVCAGDLPGVEAVYWEDAQIWQNLSGKILTRRQALKVIGYMSKTVEGLAYEDVRISPTANGFVQQHRLCGKGLNGEAFDASVCMVVTLREGKISRIEEYMDSAQLKPLTGLRRGKAERGPAPNAAPGGKAVGTQKRVVLAKRPEGSPKAEDFRLETIPHEPPELSDGQLYVKTLMLTIDPAIRGWLADKRSYLPPVALGEAVRSGSIVEVVASKNPKFPVGTKLATLTAWEEYSLLGPKVHARPLGETPGFDLSAQLSVLGGNGLTAYFGMLRIGKPKPGDTVVVSAAAGGVGSLAVQIAKAQGARVVGIAGGPDKCRWVVEELGAAACIDYKQADLMPALKESCPKGINVYFDNVGGPILDAVLARIAIGARVVLCGAISQINAAELPPGPKNYMRLLSQRARMEGFVTLDFAAEWASAARELAQWVKEGKLKHREEVFYGLEGAVDGFLALFSGANRGKIVVDLRPPRLAPFSPRLLALRGNSPRQASGFDP